MGGTGGGSEADGWLRAQRKDKGDRAQEKATEPDQCRPAKSLRPRLKPDVHLRARTKDYPHRNHIEGRFVSHPATFFAATTTRHALFGGAQAVRDPGRDGRKHRPILWRACKEELAQAVGGFADPERQSVGGAPLSLAGSFFT